VTFDPCVKPRLSVIVGGAHQGSAAPQSHATRRSGCGFTHISSSTKERTDEMADLILNASGRLGKLKKSGHLVGTQVDRKVVPSAVSP
jgi:hypothetical protein